MFTSNWTVLIKLSALTTHKTSTWRVHGRILGSQKNWICRQKHKWHFSYNLQSQKNAGNPCKRLPGPTDSHYWHKILFEIKYNLLFRDGELYQLSIGHECAQHLPKVRNRKIWLPWNLVKTHFCQGSSKTKNFLNPYCIRKLAFYSCTARTDFL